MMYYARGGSGLELTPDDLKAALTEALDRLGPRERVLAVPPDITRLPSQAGPLTRYVHEYYGDRLTGILPATGTHLPMSEGQIEYMFGNLPRSLFAVHDWRNDLETLGRIESDRIRELSEGKLDFDWPAQVNRRIASGEHDLVLSIGQVVPHEVIGMANYNKNIFVGTGGAEAIAKSHYLGAVYGMERIMGRADSPVRAVLNEATDRFARNLPIVYILTVVEAVSGGTMPRVVVRGLFVGDDAECYYRAAELAREVNVFLLDEPIGKIVAYMDPREYVSTWVGNKAIYRTRMALADAGELVVIAPGVRQFGENELFDRLIARHGYRGSRKTLDAVESDEELRGALGVAAHLIHGSSEGRFRIRYAAGALTSEQISSIGFEPYDLSEALARYPADQMRDGWNKLPDGEQVYYISNPALGLWAEATRFNQCEGANAWQTSD